MLLKRFIPRAARASLRTKMRKATGLHRTGRAAFSQEGEDLVLSRLLGVEERNAGGFYVDVGAHHGERFSNTMFFYQRGWRGINIDPSPEAIASLMELRPLDVNLQVAVSDEQKAIDYVIFNEPALNGSDLDLAKRRHGRNGFWIEKKLIVTARRLDEILDEHLPPSTQIDFLSVDVEGHDLAVLRSNAWRKYRPRIVLAEDMNVASLDEVNASPITAYLRTVGYVPVSKCALTLVFGDSERICRTELGVRIQ